MGNGDEEEKARLPPEFRNRPFVVLPLCQDYNLLPSNCLRKDEGWGELSCQATVDGCGELICLLAEARY